MIPLRNTYFVLGLISLVVFVSGGVVVFAVAASEGQLMYPPVWFLIQAIPFGAVFSFLASNFLIKIKEKTRSGKLSTVTLVVDMVLVCWLYFLWMNWTKFWGVLRWL